MSFIEIWLLVLSILVLIQQWQIRATAKLEINLATLYLALVRGYAFIRKMDAGAPNKEMDKEKQA